MGNNNKPRRTFEADRIIIVSRWIETGILTDALIDIVTLTLCQTVSNHIYVTFTMHNYPIKLIGRGGER
jgi:hypothetical protein